MIVRPHLALVAVLLLSGLAAQEPPMPAPAQVRPQQGPQGQAPQGQGQQGQGQQEPAPPGAGRPQQGEEQRPEGQRRGRRAGQRGQGPGRRGAGNAAEGEEDQEGEDEQEREKPPRRGIPVTDMLVQTHCTRCHERNADGLMTRISYVRMSPEGWSEVLKRMIRLYDLKVSPAEAKEMVRYLATDHGLTRSEAERSLYESERRVHWSEEHHDQDFRQACSACHTLGRVLAQARDPEEWQLLRATHVAMFPLARGQMGGGPPDEERDRGSFGPGPGPGQPAGRANGRPAARGGQRGAPGEADAEAARRFGGAAADRGDRVLQALSGSQPLFTPEYEQWVANRREVPLAGTWTVTGHETGKGDLLGTAELVRTDADEYDVHWHLAYQDGEVVDRTGKGLLYAGYSWRGRATDPGAGGRSWREVLLLDERWDALRGRIFNGDYDEFGVDVDLVRRRGRPRVLAVASPWVTVPAAGQVLDVHGDAFPEGIAAADFHLGRGVTVRSCERLAADHVRLSLDVAPGTECGPREVAFGPEPARARIELYDAVDYVRIRPLQGLARLGGVHYPKQFERFEAIAVHRGKDGKPFTDDDVDLWMVPARWKLVEAPVRDDDDDLQFVGAIDPATGVFTPAVEGPNQARKWSANNTGEVYVECLAELRVPVRAEPQKPPAAAAAEESPGRSAGRGPSPAAVPQEPAAAPAGGQPKTELRTFRARASLLVTVPQYVRWTALQWEDR